MVEDTQTDVHAGPDISSSDGRVVGASGALPPMLNALDELRADPGVRRFEIGEILFAQFSCPPGDAGIWTQTDYLMHVLSGTSRWRTASGTGSVRAGETVYLKKGAYVLPNHLSDELCVQLYFIPDSFVRETILHLAAQLPAPAKPIAAPGTVIPVMPDIALSAFFHAMRVYFAADEDPPEALLKLKLQELITSILLSRSNPRGLRADVSPQPVLIQEGLSQALWNLAGKMAPGAALDPLGLAAADDRPERHRGHARVRIRGPVALQQGIQGEVRATTECLSRCDGVTRPSAAGGETAPRGRARDRAAWTLGPNV